MTLPFLENFTARMWNRESEILFMLQIKFETFIVALHATLVCLVCNWKRYISECLCEAVMQLKTSSFEWAESLCQKGEDHYDMKNKCPALGVKVKITSFYSLWERLVFRGNDAYLRHA